MFKSSSDESEIFRSMEKTLVKSQSETAHGGSRKLAKAANLLNEAISIFVQAGMLQEADMIAEVWNSLASEDNNDAKSVSWHTLANETKHHLTKLDPNGGWQHLETRLLIPQLDGSASSIDNAQLILARHLTPNDMVRF